MKPLVIYHDSCTDGFAAAYAAYTVFGNSAEYFPCQYGKRAAAFDLDVTDREVYILDFSLPFATMLQLFAHACRVVWLDHHKTAFEMWGTDNGSGNIEEFKRVDQLFDGKHPVVLDNHKCGAILAWEYFHPGGAVPEIFKYIDDYDRWIFQYEDTKAIQQALRCFTPWTFEQWDTWCSKWNDVCPHLLSGGQLLLRNHEQQVAGTVKSASMPCRVVPTVIDSSASYRSPWTWTPEDVCCAEGLAANCPPHLQSSVGNALAKESGTFGLLWTVNKDGQCLCSLRSIGDYDVSAIAKVFGGGGHKNAAGFSTTLPVLMAWLSIGQDGDTDNA